MVTQLSSSISRTPTSHKHQAAHPPSLSRASPRPWRCEAPRLSAAVVSLAVTSASASLGVLNVSRLWGRAGRRSRGSRDSRGSRAAVVAVCAANEAKSELLDLLSGNWDSSRVNAAQRVEDLVAELVTSFDKEKLKSEDAQKLLAGRWKLLNTFTPGQAAANLFSLKSWQEYVFGKGPSPVQAAAFTNSAVQKEPCRWLVSSRSSVCLANV